MPKHSPLYCCYHKILLDTPKAPQSKNRVFSKTTPNDFVNFDLKMIVRHNSNRTVKSGKCNPFWVEFPSKFTINMMLVCSILINNCSKTNNICNSTIFYKCLLCLRLDAYFTIYNVYSIYNVP